MRVDVRLIPAKRKSENGIKLKLSGKYGLPKYAYPPWVEKFISSLSLENKGVVGRGVKKWEKDAERY